MLASRLVLSLERLLNTRWAYGGRFDADGKRLYFVSDLAGVPQVWAAGSERWPELVVATPDRAQAVYPGPRAGTLVVMHDVGGDERNQLLLVDGARRQPLTDAPTRVHHFGDWSADGWRVSFNANGRDSRWFDVYVRDLRSGETRSVLQDDSTNSGGEFSPDGRWLVVTRVFSSSHQQLWLVDLEGREAPRLLTRDAREAKYESAQWLPDGRRLMLRSDLDREMDAPALLDVESGELHYSVDHDVEADSQTLSRDGRRLAYALNRDGSAEIRVRDLVDGVEYRVESLPGGSLYEYWQRGLAWDPSGTRLAISWFGPRHNQNVWVHDVRTRKTRQVTHAPRAGVSERRLVEPELVRYPTFDGREIPALWYGPTRRAATAPPCIVFVHGGPEGQSRPTFNPVIQHLASAGFAVLAPNVRGSSGYGKTYLHLDDVYRRMDSVADLARAALWLRATGRADPERIAVYGGSYGGFMVLAALTTYPDLWAAGVDLVGIANFVTFLEHTGPWRRHLREVEYGSLERDREFLERISPINHVEKITAPLLVIHGANDPRVPIVETEQIVARLQALGRTVELVRFEDEGHSISKLKNKLVAYPRAVDFLRRHLRARKRAPKRELAAPAAR